MGSFWFDGDWNILSHQRTNSLRVHMFRTFLVNANKTAVHRNDYKYIFFICFSKCCFQCLKHSKRTNCGLKFDRNVVKD